MYSHIANETALRHNPPLHNFAGERKNTWPILNRPTLQHVTFAQK